MVNNKKRKSTKNNVVPTTVRVTMHPQYLERSIWTTSNQAVQFENE
jgi:hypothetical protein